MYRHGISNFEKYFTCHFASPGLPHCHHVCLFGHQVERVLHFVSASYACLRGVLTEAGVDEKMVDAPEVCCGHLKELELRLDVVGHSERIKCFCIIFNIHMLLCFLTSSS